MLHIKLRGVSPEGGFTVAGKTSEHKPRWETNLGRSALGKGRDATIPLGLAKDWLDKQRAEFVAKESVQKYERDQLVKDLHVARKNMASLHRTHDQHVHSLVLMQHAHVSALVADLSLQESSLEALSAEAGALERKHEQVLSRKLVMIDRRDRKLEAAERNITELEEERVRLQGSTELLRSTVAELETTIKLHIATVKKYRLEEKELRQSLSTMQEARAVLETDNNDLREKQTARVATIQRLAGQCGGRPVVNRTSEALTEQTLDVARKTKQAMAERVSACTGKHGTEGAIAVVRPWCRAWRLLGTCRRSGRAARSGSFACSGWEI